MTEQKTTTYVTYLIPGLIVADESSREVPDRDPERIAREAERSVVAFKFFDKVSTTVTVDGLELQAASQPFRRSGWYYIDGEAFTAEQVAALDGNHSILLDNMRSNGWERVVRCRTGGFQPLRDGDTVISSGQA